MSTPPPSLELDDVQYELDRALCWVELDEASPGDALWTDVEARIAVIGRSFAADRAAHPVYRAKASGQLAVPTGRVFVRLRKGSNAEARSAAFAAAGFELEQAPDWAPEAAWLRFSRDDVGAALHAIARLQALPDVESAQPELLRTRALRDA